MPSGRRASPWELLDCASRFMPTTSRQYCLNLPRPLPMPSNMRDLVILGTDTDAGKTTFALLWLTAFADQFAYWKPLETGPSDTETIRRLVPSATVHEPIARFAEPVAPLLAARREGREVPTSGQLIASRSAGELPLLIETFGGPFSPLNESESQNQFIRLLDASYLLASQSTIGAIGRCAAMIRALRAEGVELAAVILVGEPDPFAEVELRKRSDIEVVSLRPPLLWNVESLQAAACWPAACPACRLGCPTTFGRPSCDITNPHSAG